MIKKYKIQNTIIKILRWDGCFTQGISQKKKLVKFSGNWEIRLVFTKIRHHGCRQENFCRYKPQNSRKCHPGKEIFQSMTLQNTHKSSLRNVFFFH